MTLTKSEGQIKEPRKTNVYPTCVFSDIPLFLKDVKNVVELLRENLATGIIKPIAEKSKSSLLHSYVGSFNLSKIIGTARTNQCNAISFPETICAKYSA